MAKQHPEKLQKEMVKLLHHKDFDRQNNNPDNLYLCKNHREHQKLHYSLEEVARELYRKEILGFKNGKYYWK